MSAEGVSSALQGVRIVEVVLTSRDLSRRLFVCIYCVCSVGFAVQSVICATGRTANGMQISFVLLPCLLGLYVISAGNQESHPIIQQVVTAGIDPHVPTVRPEAVFHFLIGKQILVY